MIEIAGRRIGPNEPPFFVADIGSNWDASLDRAYALIDLAAAAGVDAVKFQNFSASKIVSRRGFEELGRIGHQEAWAKPVYETYEDASIPLSWTNVLADRCKEAGVAYLTTPYDLEAVDAIDPYVPAWKVGSGDITYLELIRHVASKGKPLFVGTGASNDYDVRRAWNALPDREARERTVLLQCNSDYRGDPEAIRSTNLRVLTNWADCYGPVGVPFGISDHTPGDLTVCAAVALGACVIEKHFTDDATRSGPDHAFAMEPYAWREMIAAAHRTWEALGDGVKRVEENEREAVIVQRRALRYSQDLRKGVCLPPEYVVPTRPCPPGALAPYEVDRVVGKKLTKDVGADTPVRLEDFE